MEKQCLLRISQILIFLVTGSQCYRSMGCYKENSVEARLMPEVFINFESVNSPDKCVTYCQSKGFSYAGLQVGNECFCSHQRPSYKVSTDLSECNYPCPGNDKEKCGGVWRLSVYDIEDKGENHVQTNYIGCYPDVDEVRSLNGIQEMPDVQGDLIPEKCVGFCYRHGYMLAGVQDGYQCFCSDTISMGRVKDEDCNVKCFGDNRLVCGGPWRHSVYNTSISDFSKGRFLGCFNDDSKVRLLTGLREPLTMPETNSPQRCVNICKQLGFRYAGVENGNQCFCGDHQPEKEKETNEYECILPCPGGGPRRCGGQGRLLVYSTTLF